MTTEDIIIHIFYLVDERMKAVKRVPQTHLYPSEIVTIGIKLCWLVNRFGQVVGWQWATMNRPDQDFHPLLSAQEDNTIVLADLGFRCKEGIPANLKLCPKGTWNERMVVETIFSMLTVVCKAKKMHHRVQAYLEVRLAYTAAMFNVLLTLFHQLHPDADPGKLSIAEFSL